MKAIFLIIAIATWCAAMAYSALGQDKPTRRAQGNTNPRASLSRPSVVIQPTTELYVVPGEQWRRAGSASIDVPRGTSILNGAPAKVEFMPIPTHSDAKAILIPTVSDARLVLLAEDPVRIAK